MMNSVQSLFRKLMSHLIIGPEGKDGDGHKGAEDKQDEDPGCQFAAKKCWSKLHNSGLCSAHNFHACLRHGNSRSMSFV